MFFCPRYFLSLGTLGLGWVEGWYPGGVGPPGGGIPLFVIFQCEAPKFLKFLDSKTDRPKVGPPQVLKPYLCPPPPGSRRKPANGAIQHAAASCGPGGRGGGGTPAQPGQPVGGAVKSLVCCCVIPPVVPGAAWARTLLASWLLAIAWPSFEQLPPPWEGVAARWSVVFPPSKLSPREHLLSIHV